MISRLAIPVIAVVLLCTLYFDLTVWRHKKWWLRLLAWLPSLAVVGITLVMADTPYYFPEQIYKYHYYITLLMVFVVPLLLVTLCTLVGRLVKRPRGGQLTGWALSLVCVLAYVYGSTIGFHQLEVVRVEFASADLPEAFDGYKIVQFSDAHVGTYALGRQDILKRAVDSINAQHADMVVFTGDIQNKLPSEVEEFIPLLSSIEAADGVFSVLGNHDYPMYMNTDDFIEISSSLGRTESYQSDMGWILLLNDHRRIRRDSSSIVIAGMENDGKPGGRFPQNGSVSGALNGVRRDEFVIMLEHDPTCWQRKILPHCHAQLTLSGHTHGGQLSLFGWSPASLSYDEYAGMYYNGDRALYVSNGLGGVIPFRLGVPGEITVITLKKK